MKMNNKGFATSLILFGLLVLFLVVISTLFFTMNNSYALNNILKKDLLSSIENDGKNKIYAVELYYDNSNTNLGCDTVQCALDKIGEMVKK